MANPINFIEMIPHATRSGNSDPPYLNDLRVVEGELLMFKHATRGSSPGDVVAGEALSSSIKAAATIVYTAEARLDTISKLEALKIASLTASVSSLSDTSRFFGSDFMALLLKNSGPKMPP